MASRTTNNWSERRSGGRCSLLLFLPVANKAERDGGERKAKEEEEEEEENGANAASETATALCRRGNRCPLQRAANVQKRKSERRLPIYLFASYFFNGLTVLQENFKANDLKVEIDEKRRNLPQYCSP